ncbi:MAG: outer membrane lipoprotein-sorting protein [Deltaproteobacteria bacterium]|nr:outer membrane lipoprotein-sorting protein [Deltaproteobacteria bacterium]
MLRSRARSVRGRAGSLRDSAGPAPVLGGSLLLLGLALALMASPRARADAFQAPGASATLAEIEACARRSLPDAAGVVSFRVDAIDRTGTVTTSRAEMRWRADEEQRARVLLRVSEPAKTAGTALLIVDRAAGQPEFFVRLPDQGRVRRIRSRRLRGPVLGTDFSYEDLERFRDPLERTDLELVGIDEIEGRSAWLLEAIPGKQDGSEYTRVLTWVEQQRCLPIRIDFYAAGDRLRKRLDAPLDSFRTVGESLLPHAFVMQDLRRETRTEVRVEQVDVAADLPPDQFTKRALQDSPPAALAR